jgi:protocatechuate 3,4-dioxygenase beta subunit
MIHSMTRREAVALVGLSGVALLARRAAAQGTGRAPACVVRPQQSEGPFFIDEKLNRSDIRGEPGRGEAKAGAVLQLAFAVSRLSGGACAPLGGAQVDVWHCDALGAYSDGAQKFLRGYQVTDETGAARFVTIYPGAYGGRAVHIHFKIRLTAQRQEFTSQIYFDEAVTDRVYALEPYARNGQRRLRNDGDGLFRSGGRQLLVTPTPSGAGYATTFDIALST